MSKLEQIEAIKYDIEVFENAPNLYFASNTRKTQIAIVLSENNRQAIINYLKQRIKELENDLEELNND